MKKLRTLYLIASEEAFRLVHTHEPDWALIATHNLELAARMDRTVRLDQGRVMAINAK